MCENAKNRNATRIIFPRSIQIECACEVVGTQGRLDEYFVLARLSIFEFLHGQDPKQTLSANGTSYHLREQA
jgi:hypothetical protein